MSFSHFGGRATIHRSALTAAGIAALLVAFGRSEPPAALADESPTVVRGREAVSGAHPWMAALLEADEPDARRAQFCGATLVAPSWVLTAAHCVEADRGGFLHPSSIDVGLGLHDLSRDSGQRIGVRRVLPHSGYEQDDGLDQDIALLELERPAVLGPRVATARLATAGDTPPIGASVTVTGWGETESGRASRTLREATTHIVADGRCEAEPDVLCADGQVQDACFGDSGGPLVTRAADGAWTQVGVVSYGTSDDCGRRGNFSGYANVGFFADWITQRVGAAAPAPATPSPTAAPPARPSPEPAPPGDPGAPGDPDPNPNPTCTASLRGKVRDDWGRGLPFAEVRLIRGMEQEQILETNARGAYRAEGLCAGDYLVMALAFDDTGWPVAGAHDPDEDYVPDRVELSDGEERRGIDVYLELSDWTTFSWSLPTTEAILPVAYLGR
jgi:hypothetical protein